MPLHPTDLPPHRAHLVVPVRCDATGISGPTREQVSCTDWRRTSRGCYVPHWVDGTSPEQRIVEAAAVLPDFGGITGWAALRWYGGIWFDGLTPDGRSRLPVDLATGYADVRSQSGLLVTQERLSPHELLDHDGLTMTTPARSACFLMRYAVSDREATVAADMAAYSDLVDGRELADYALAHPGWTGIPRARRAIALAEENSWSPWETRVRLVWQLDADLPRPLCNAPLFDLAGRHLGTPDLFDPEAGVAVEYDGALHLAGVQRTRDLAREELFRLHGMEYLTVLSSHLLDRAQLADRMIRVHREGRRRGPSRRTWTLERPPGWVDTSTVTARRELTDQQRLRFLRLRRRVC